MGIGGRALRFGWVGRRPAQSRAEWRDRVRQVDAWGYDVLLMPDHLGMAPPFPGLVAAADASDRLRFGTHVVNVQLWNPGLLAREAAGVDILTGGRLELGLGAGNAAAELRALGLAYPPPDERAALLAEVVPLVRRLLAGEEVTSGGRRRLDRCAIGLAPTQKRIPLMVGGNGDRVLAVAARHADIVGIVGFTAGRGPHDNQLSHFTWAGLADRVAHVRQEAGSREAGTQEVELSVLLQAVVLTDHRARRAEELALANDQPLPVVLDSPFMMIGSVGEAAEHVRRLREEHGVTHLTVLEPYAEAFAQVIARLR